MRFPGPSGRLEAVLDEPDGVPGGADEGAKAGRDPHVRAAVVFGHPHRQHGGTMRSKVVRGTGLSAGSFDEGAGEQDDFRAALDFMRTRYPEAPLGAGGMSFGSWVGMQLVVIDGADHAFDGHVGEVGDALEDLLGDWVG